MEDETLPDAEQRDGLPHTLEELRLVDRRTQGFTPLGLGRSHILTPEGTVTFQYELMAAIVLADAVPDNTRNAFDQVRSAFIYGALSYDLFTLAEDRARLLMELAFRDRFMTYYATGVPIRDRDGATTLLTGGSFHDIKEQLDTIHPADRNLELPRAGSTIPSFNGMLGGLRRWAEQEGLLPGQRARQVAAAQKHLRDLTAHPTHYQLSSPVEAARVIRDIAEIINCLWDVRTPGGRLHPAPVRRTAVAMSWNSTGDTEACAANELPSVRLRGPLTTILVRASTQNPDDLWCFDALYTTTQSPIDLLWGPGTPTDALEWYRDHQPEDDEADPLDRDFLIRHHADRIDPPRSPGLAAGLPTNDQHGQWHLIRADDPISAYNHTRNLINGAPGCNRDKPCPHCPATTILIGTLPDVLDHLKSLGKAVDPIKSADIRVPSPLPRWGETPDT